MRLNDHRVEAEDRRFTPAREAEANSLRLLQQMDEQPAANAQLEDELLLLADQ